MKTTASLIALSLAACLPLTAQGRDKPLLSIKLETKRAIERGNEYLKSVQHADGYWNNPKYPAYTALALTGALRSPSYKDAEYVRKGLDWLVKQQKTDESKKDHGGIYVEGLGTYNTATSIVALVASGDKKYYPAILKARAYLIRMQANPGNLGDLDEKHLGGIGYGGSYKHSDLSNTHLSIEALRLSAHIARDNADGKQPELDWEAAIGFVSRVQNLKETNKTDGISNDGSFNYYVGGSKANPHIQPNGTELLRGYGSMSYAGLLSMIYADLDEKDVRVKAVKKWLREHYSVKENPGLATKEHPELGQQGLFYYYQAMAKALTAANIDKLTLKDGTQADWRRDLAREILSKQRENGSWINTGNSRWWENESELVTAYGVITLGQIYQSIPQ
ncbi:MAG: prenyltransferase/squalene oxidase repeat-containing protein [Akkermansiaceae bacterium]